MDKEEPYFEYAEHDEQNDWSPNDEIDPDLQEPEDFTPCTRKMNYN